jgi:hypothetical protein
LTYLLPQNAHGMETKIILELSSEKASEQSPTWRNLKIVVINSIFGWTSILLGLFFLCLYWPVGLTLFVAGVICLVASHVNDGTIIPVAQQGRTMEFGPGEPPWAEQEAPILCGDHTIFASAIQSVCEWGPTGPQIDVHGGIRKTRPGTARPACIVIPLHSGDSHAVTGATEERLRRWYDFYGS